MSMKDADKNNHPINIKNFAALAGIVLLAAPALAQELPDQSSSLPPAGKAEPSHLEPVHSGFRGHHPAGAGRNFQELDLKASQKALLGKIRDEFTLSTAPKEAELKVAMRQLMELLHSDTVDKQAALALQSKINTLKADLSTARLNMMLASGEVFTPEQKAKMKEWRKGGCPGGRCGAPGSFGKELKSRAQDAKPIS